MATEEDVIAALKTVQDPELLLDIWFLGLVYRVEVKETAGANEQAGEGDGVDEEVGTQDAKIEVDMTFTSPMCPAGPMLIEDVKRKVGEIEGVSEVEVKIVFDPPWEPSDDVKAMLGMM